MGPPVHGVLPAVSHVLCVCVSVLVLSVRGKRSAVQAGTDIYVAFQLILCVTAAALKLGSGSYVSELAGSVAFHFSCAALR